MRSHELTAQDIEIALADYFGYRRNLVVPNVYWGWGLRHEADLIVLRPSGLCDEVEIKVTAADIRADAKKQWSHWESGRISRVWFAVPARLSGCQDIPAAAGILAVSRDVVDVDAGGRSCWRPVCPDDRPSTWRDRVVVVRPAKLRAGQQRKPVTTEQRLKLAELGAMRIWDLKKNLARRARDNRQAKERECNLKSS